MEKIDIQAKTRQKESAQKIRNGGYIPAIVYGHNIPTVELVVQYSPFDKAFRAAGESTIINLDIDGAPARNVIIKEVQRHYLTGRYQHIDFHEVSMTEKMVASVPLVFIGVSKAVKENGGILVHVLNELEVECLPADLPSHIEVDLSPLNEFGDTIRVSDIAAIKGVEILSDSEETIVKADMPRNLEAELAKPVVEDVSKVEGAAEDKPVSLGDEGKAVKKEDVKGAAKDGKEAKDSK
jgi:large subunit ribosomal protein L25